MEENKTVTAGEKALVYFALFSLVFTASFIGLAEFISFVFLPALLAYTIVRLGYKHMILQCGLVILLYSFANGGFYEAALLTLLPGVSVGICVRKKRSLLYTVTACSFSLIAAELIVYLIDVFRTDTQMHFLQMFTAQSTQMVEMLGLPAKESALLLQMMDTYTPAIILLSVAMLSYSVVWVVCFLLRRRAPALAVCYPRFRDLYVPKSCLLIWILAWIVSFFDSGAWGVTAANLAMLLSSYIIICGFALFVFWISGARSAMLRTVLYIGLFWMFSVATPAAFVLGILDRVFHFRDGKRGDMQ